MIGLSIQNWPRSYQDLMERPVSFTCLIEDMTSLQPKRLKRLRKYCNKKSLSKCSGFLFESVNKILLLSSSLVRNGQFLTAFGSTRFNHVSSTNTFHSASEAVLVGSLFSWWLECPFHSRLNCGPQRYTCFVTPQTTFNLLCLALITALTLFTPKERNGSKTGQIR